jgi:hypothetical protein
LTICFNPPKLKVRLLPSSVSKSVSGFIVWDYPQELFYLLAVT